MPRPAKNPPPPPPGYVWTPEAARRLGLSVKTLWNYRHLGKGPASKPIGRKLAYPIDELDDWLAAELDSHADADQVHESRPPEARISRSNATKSAA